MMARRTSEHDFEQALGTVTEEADHLDRGAEDIVREVAEQTDTIRHRLADVDGFKEQIDRLLSDLAEAAGEIGEAVEVIERQGRDAVTSAAQIASQLRDAASVLEDGGRSEDAYEELEQERDELQAEVAGLKQTVRTMWIAFATPGKCPECDHYFPGHADSCDIGRILREDA